MRFEQIDKKVQEAAEKHHPAYDENAWQKMEKLLNQHLPVKKDDKRRVFLLLLLLLLIGGGGFLLLSKPGSKNSDIASREKANNERLANEKKPASANASGTQTVTQNNVEHNTRSSQVVTQNVKTQDVFPSTNMLRHDLTRTETKSSPRGETTSTHRADNNVTSKAVTEQNNIPAQKLDEGQLNEPAKGNSAIQNSIESKKDDVNRDVTTNVNEKTQAPQTAQAQTVKPPIHKEKSNWLSGFALLLSAGPDVSKAGGSQLGKLTLAYGAGISYTKNRFTLRTGVYGTRKIYTAGPNDYEMSVQWSNLKFEGADADCYVMEIPVGLYYNFASKNKSNWFAGAGLSSYLMKRETYDYHFKSNTGGSYSWAYTEKNKNKHYFSVLDLSAGYSLHLNKTVSLSAEPYLKIPFSGIGAGKVPLNSAGVLFTVGIKPFK